jgi:hypothetical protein
MATRKASLSTCVMGSAPSPSTIAQSVFSSAVGPGEPEAPDVARGARQGRRRGRCHVHRPAHTGAGTAAHPGTVGAETLRPTPSATRATPVAVSLTVHPGARGGAAPSRRGYFFPSHSRRSCGLTLRWHWSHWQVVSWHDNWPVLGSTKRRCWSRGQFTFMAILPHEDSRR